jgi:hypothetical protein
MIEDVLLKNNEIQFDSDMKYSYIEKHCTHLENMSCGLE